MAKLPDFDTLTIPELKEAIAAAQAALDAKTAARRAELLAELQALGDAPVAPKAPRVRGVTDKPEGDGRAKPKPMYRAPNGWKWSGRGALPKVFRDLGVTDKAGLEAYRIKD